MIIRSITIENFQSYYGSQTLEFSKGLNLIIGKGGKGKSKLFNAFYWVLFGKIYINGIGWCTTDTLPNSARMSMQKHEFVNTKSLYDCPENGIVNTSVSLELEDDNGVMHLIDRSVQTRRINNGNNDSPSTWDVSENNVKISFDSNNGTLVRTGIDAEYKINTLFPDGIRNYIWFQGETLESLINFRNKETLKEAVKHISYYPYYEKLSDIIAKSKQKIATLESKRLSEVNKHNTNVKNLLSTIETNRKFIEIEEAKLKQTEENIELIKMRLAESENKITGLAKYTGLVQKYHECNDEIARINDEINDNDKFQRRQLPKLWILRTIDPMIEDCKSIIERHKMDEYTVPEKKYLDNPSRSKLEEILRDGKCYVCGSDTSEGTAAYHYIQERMRLQEEYLREMEEYTNNMQFSKMFNMFVGKIQDYPDALLSSLSKIDKQYSESEERIESLIAKRKKLLERKKNIDSEIEEIKAKNGVNPVEQADSADIINTTIRASRGNLEREQKKAEASKQTIAGYKQELNAAEKELGELSKKDKTIEKVAETEWKNISIFLENICKNVQENARKDLLHKIEERANLFYAKFTEHDNGYKGNVKIGEDYSIEFDAGLNTSHEDRKKMSIINALLFLNQEAVGTYYPFISDAPTSNFDLETTHKYLLGIKDIFRQSIIMTKDVDIDSDNYKDLLSQSNVSRIYLLESELYCDDKKDPDRHEVSTKVLRKK